MKTPLVTARVALLKFNQVLFALTFQSMPTVHIVFKVVSLYTQMCVRVCLCVHVCADQTTATTFHRNPEYNVTRRLTVSFFMIQVCVVACVSSVFLCVRGCVRACVPVSGCAQAIWAQPAGFDDP